jgi:hypothetical protein
MRCNIVRVHFGVTDAKRNVTTWLRLWHGVLCGLTDLAITRAEREFFASEGTVAARSSGRNGSGFIAVLCRLAAGAFPVLLKQFRNGTQRFVHLLSGSKFACDVRFQDDDISTFSISCSVLAPHTFAEVIFWTHCTLVLR